MDKSKEFKITLEELEAICDVNINVGARAYFRNSFRNRNDFGLRDTYMLVFAVREAARKYEVLR